MPIDKLCFLEKGKNFNCRHSVKIFAFIISSMFIFLFFVYSDEISAAQRKVVFDPSTDNRVIGYKLYYGQAEEFHTIVDLQDYTSYDLPELEEGATYYFAASAYDAYGNESALSDMLTYSVPITDTDGDGIADSLDGCPDDPGKTEPGVCGCGVPDIDTDGDGVMDCFDNCPADPNKTEPGVCGCGVPDIDSDGDGFMDCIDGCPDDPDKTEAGVCGCGVSDADSDGNGLPDCVDQCYYNWSPVVTLVFDASSDERVIGYKLYYGKSEEFDTVIDLGNNTSYDLTDLESGVTYYFAATAYDGFVNESGFSEILVYTAPESTVDCDSVDGCPFDPDKTEPGVCGCGVPDIDTDGDGIMDCIDGCPADPGKT
ncbi:MAG: thrombospondin type 3 repeat-containing protein, partial [Desulfobacterales bacterium]